MLIKQDYAKPSQGPTIQKHCNSGNALLDVIMLTIEPSTRVPIILKPIGTGIKYCRVVCYHVGLENR